MATDDQQSRYDETRRQFNELGPEDQARFLVEATASTLAHGIEQVGHALADGIEDVVRQARTRSARGRKGKRHGPGPAEPETSQRQQARNSPHDDSPSEA